jgi:2''-5'' RNA ligase
VGVYVLQAAETEQQSLCVMFKVSPELARKFPPLIKPDGSIASMPPHCTILFTKLNEFERKLARDVIRKVVAKVSPFQVRLGGKGTFPNLVWVPVKGPGPSRLHEKLLDALREAGIKAEQTHEEYKPHCSLAYTDDPKGWKGEVPSGSFWVREVELWFSDNKKKAAHRYKLGTRLRRR